MAAKMRAKMKLNHIDTAKHDDGTTSTESLHFAAVARNDKYPDDGSDENNTYARFSPTADLKIVIANPALHGKFNEGEHYYVDFTPAE